MLKSSTKTLSGLSILIAFVSQVRPKSVDPKFGVGVVEVDIVLLLAVGAGLLLLNLSTVVDTCAVSSISFGIFSI